MRILLTGGAGYIGCALLRHLLAAGHDLTVCDSAPVSSTYAASYQSLDHEDISAFDTIVHLAAHSSVAACGADPRSAISNNLFDLAPFLRLLREDQKFIFASTGSILDRNRSHLYDETKRAAEAIIPILHPNSHILRFGTVCGVSPKMREDLILNGMVRDAVRAGEIHVWNPGAWRPVLFFPDLCYAVETLVAGDAPRGVYYLASFQTKIGGWADMVAHIMGAKIIDKGVSPHYDFGMRILPQSLTTPEKVIGELADYWRSRS